jgi:hypothetical protein
MNTGTILGNPIKRIFLKSDTSTRTWQTNCFYNDTLKDVYLTTSGYATITKVPTLNTIFTATQKADSSLRIYTMRPQDSNAMYTSSILPQDYKRYAVISWNENLTGTTEAELYASISYAQQTYSYIEGGWM